MKIYIALGVAVTVVGVAAFAWVLSMMEHPSAAEPLDIADLRVAELEEEKARLERDLQRLEEVVRNRPAEGAAAEHPPPDLTAEGTLSDAPFEGPTAETEAAPAVEPAGSARFFTDAYGGAMTKVDWKMVGANLKEMNPLIVEIVNSIRAERRPEQATIGRVQQLNRPLLVAALSLPEEVPGVGVNGKFSDPSFMVNAMASCLDAAELPLSTQQEQDLVAVAEKWMGHDERRRAGYDESTYSLRKIFEEAELKDGYFPEALAVLTVDQRAVVDPAETHDRVQLALFSSSLVYAGRVEICFCTSTEDLKAKYLRRTARIFNFSDADRELVRPIVEGWVDSVPVEDREAEVDALDRSGLVESSRVTTWARHILDLIQQVVARMPLSEEQRETARTIGGVYLPLKVEAE